MSYQRAYKFRCSPTDAQAAVLARTFGCARFVSNWGLKLRTDAYYDRHEKIGDHDTSAALTELKRQPDTPWLNDVARVPVQPAVRHLDQAFRNFFAGQAQYPTFHTQHGKQAATSARSAFRWDAEARTLTWAKMEAPLPIRWSRSFSGAPTTISLTRDRAGRYFVSVLVEEEMDMLPVLDTAMGVDAGLIDLMTLRTGEKVKQPKHLARSHKRLKRAQPSLARKQKGSRKREKARRKGARIHAQIADQRNDSRHKLTTRLIRENQAICVESFASKNVVRNHHLARSSSAAAWGELVRQLDYKAQWSGRTLVKIDRWYPSSRRWHDCGHGVNSLPLAMRTWTCPHCGMAHDRDVNAAQNILAVGLTVSACGELVRPATASARAGADR
jgi:putative transposase